jgi:hypothetical protein
VRIKEKLIYIILIYINFTFILMLLEKGIKIENFNYKFTSTLFIIGLLIYSFYNYTLRKPIYMGLFTLLMVSISGAYYLKNIEVLGKLFNNYFFEDITILNDLIYEGAITYFYQYKILLILGIPLIIALMLWITFIYIKEFILIFSSVVVIGLWFSRSYVVVKEYLFIYLVVSSFTFIITTYIKRIQRYKDEGVNVTFKFSYILIYAIIISLMISKITIMLPQEFEGKNVTYFSNFFKNAFARESSVLNKVKYGLSASGYSNSNERLGGPVSINYQEVFKVKSDKAYYLKGNTLDFYDGNKWARSNEINYKNVSGKDMKYVSFGYNLMNNKNSLTIYPNKDFINNTMFVPNYTFNVSGAEGTLFYDKVPVVLSENIVKSAYTIKFYESSEVFDTIEDVRDYKTEITEKDRLSNNVYLPMDYLLRPTYKEINKSINKNIPNEDRFSYRNREDFKVLEYYSEYLQVPENISNRTYELVQEITKDSFSSIEKVLKIKKYLTKNYSYDLQVSVVPEGSEFIDYFLFEEKKGYCTYFNTAMSIMCRIAGVPARYVEGFKTPSKKDDKGLYSVSNSDAHGWSEVILGASYYENMWTIVDASPTVSEDIQRELKERKEKQISNPDSEGADIIPIRKPQNKIEDIDYVEGQEENNKVTLSDNQLKVINILSVIILFILMRIIEVWKNRNRLLKSKEVTPLYNYYLDRLAVILIVKPEFQGDLEFAKSIKDFNLKEKMLILVRGSYEEFYGKHSVAILNNKEYYDFLEVYLKHYQGKLEYLKNKYLGEIH